MAVNIGPKIAIDGEAQYRKELQNIIQSTKTLAAETDAAAASFKNETDKEKAAAETADKLNKQIEAQKKLIEKLEDAVKKASDATGENSTETLKWKEQLAKAKTGLANLESKTSDAATEVKDLGKAEEDTGKQTSVFGDVLKANLASELVKKGLEVTYQLVKEIGDALIDAAKGAAEYGDEINTLSQTTGLSTGTLQEYRYMAQLVDVDLSTMTGALTKLKKNMNSARDGSKAQAQAFKDLGVEITDANGRLRSSEDVFNDVIAALREIKNPTERDAAAMEIFGKSATELNPLIETTAEDLASLRKEAHDAGAVLDNETIKALTGVQDGLDRVGLTWDAIKNKFGAKIGAKALPYLEDAAEVLRKFAKTGDAGELVSGIGKLLEKAAKEAQRALPGVMKKISTWLTQKGVPELAKLIGTLLGNAIASLPSFIEAGVELVGALVKGVGQALPALWTALQRGIKEAGLNDLAIEALNKADSIREEVNKIPGAFDDVKDSIAEVNAKQKESEKWLDIYDELYKKTDLTKQEQSQLKTAVEKLNEIFPELGIAIDEETGKWNYNTERIKHNIEVLGARARAAAYYNAASEALEKQVRIEQELASAQEKRADAEARQAEYAKKVEELTPLLQDLGSAYAAVIDNEQTAAEAAGDLSDATKAYLEENGIQIKTAKDLANVVKDVGTEMSAYRTEVTSATSEMDSFDQIIADAEQGLKDYQDQINWFFDQGDSWTQQAEQIGEFVVGGVIKGMENMRDSLVKESQGLINASIIGMKDKAEISSPSKVTEKLIGQNLALGVIKGWDDVMDPAKLQAAFTMQPVFEAMTAGASTTNTTNTTNLGGVSINVYPEAGTDVNALTNAIMRKMQGAVDARKAVFA